MRKKKDPANQTEPKPEPAAEKTLADPPAPRQRVYREIGQAAYENRHRMGVQRPNSSLVR